MKHRERMKAMCRAVDVGVICGDRNMATINDLIQHSNVFFEKHWDSSSSLQPLEWKCDWQWAGSVPYHDMAGIYALFDSAGDLVYVGLGASRGGGLYNEHGISRRLLAHVIAPDRSRGRGFYKPKDNWVEVADIGAVGFPAKYSYLAPALEDYLIGKLNPTRNSMKKHKA